MKFQTYIIRKTNGGNVDLELGVGRVGGTCWGGRWMPTPRQGSGTEQRFSLRIFFNTYLAGRGNHTSILKYVG